MSKKDAKEYFKQIEKQYFEIKEMCEDVQEYYNKGEMTVESAKDALHDLENAQLVYDTARIFMHKLNKKKDEKDVVDLPVEKTEEGKENK